jgi:replication factor A1
LKVVANSAYSRIKNPYELTFDVRSDIKPAADDGIKNQTYEFTKIAALQNADPGLIVDVIGIVKNCGDLSEIISQKMGGKTLQKRDILIVDDSNHDITLTLWGDKAVSCDQLTNAVVAFKGLKLGDYNGRTLGSVGSTVVKINPDIPEGHALAMWKNNNINDLTHSISLSGGGGGGGGGGAVDPLEKRKSMASIKNEQLGMGDKPEYVTVKASIGYVKKENDPWYPACNNISNDGKGCNKKMIQNNSSWICEKCQISKSSPEYRYILSCTVMDYSGMSWVTFFNDQAEKLLSTKANDLHDMKEQGQEDEYNRILAIPKFQEFNIKLRVKFELGGGGNDGENIQRQKCVVQQLYELDYSSECRQMIDAISKFD